MCGQYFAYTFVHEKALCKVMTSDFCDAYRVIFIDYLEKGRSITVYYAALLHRLVDEIMKKRSHLKKKILFHVW